MYHHKSKRGDGTLHFGLEASQFCEEETENYKTDFAPSNSDKLSLYSKWCFLDKCIPGNFDLVRNVEDWSLTILRMMLLFTNHAFILRIFVISHYSCRQLPAMWDLFVIHLEDDITPNSSLININICPRIPMTKISRPSGYFSLSAGVWNLHEPV